MTETEKEIRLKWKLKRIEQGIKQKDIANYLGVTSSYVSAYENNRFDFPPDKVRYYRQYIEGYNDETKK